MNNMIQTLKESIKQLRIEIIYFGMYIIYAHFLNAFNTDLLTKFSESEYWKILMYQNYKALWFLLFACVICLLGVLRFMNRYKEIKYADLELISIVNIFISFLIISFVIIRILVLINNPILRAFILTSIMVGAITNSK